MRGDMKKYLVVIVYNGAFVKSYCVEANHAFEIRDAMTSVGKNPYGWDAGGGHYRAEIFYIQSSPVTVEQFERDIRD